MTCPAGHAIPETERRGLGKLEDLLRAGDTWQVPDPQMVS
jgi:hypothetical protein